MSEELENARKVIKEEEAKLAEQCLKEIKEILEKYGFVMQVTQPEIVLSPKQ